LGRVRVAWLRPALVTARLDLQEIVRQHEGANLCRRSVSASTRKAPQAAVFLQVGEIQFDRAAALLQQGQGCGGLQPLPQGVESGRKALLPTPRYDSPNGLRSNRSTARAIRRAT